MALPLGGRALMVATATMGSALGGAAAHGDATSPGDDPAARRLAQPPAQAGEFPADGRVRRAHEHFQKTAQAVEELLGRFDAEHRPATGALGEATQKVSRPTHVVSLAVDAPADDDGRDFLDPQVPSARDALPAAERAREVAREAAERRARRSAGSVPLCDYVQQQMRSWPDGGLSGDDDDDDRAPLAGDGASLELAADSPSGRSPARLTHRRPEVRADLDGAGVNLYHDCWCCMNNDATRALGDSSLNPLGGEGVMIEDVQEGSAEGDKCIAELCPHLCDLENLRCNEGSGPGTVVRLLPDGSAREVQCLGVGTRVDTTCGWT